MGNNLQLTMNTARRMAEAPERENVPGTLLEEKVSQSNQRQEWLITGLSDSEDGNDDEDYLMDLDLPKANKSSADYYGWFKKYN